MNSEAPAYKHGMDLLAQETITTAMLLKDHQVNFRVDVLTSMPFTIMSTFSVLENTASICKTDLYLVSTFLFLRVPMQLHVNLKSRIASYNNVEN